MATRVGALFASLTLQSTQFTQGMRSAVGSAQTGARGISSALGGITSAVGGVTGALAGIGAALALGAIKEQVTKALDYADALGDLSAQTGASTKLIQEFGYAAQLSGSSVETARAGLEKFTTILGQAQSGSKEAQQKLADLGVTSTDVDTALRQAADGIDKLGTITEQRAATVALFGKANVDLVGTLNQGSGGLSEMAARANELGVVLSDDVIANAQSANDQLDTMKMILDAQMANFISQNAQALVTLAEGFISASTAALEFLKVLGGSSWKESAFFRQQRVRDINAELDSKTPGLFGFGAGKPFHPQGSQSRADLERERAGLLAIGDVDALARGVNTPHINRPARGGTIPTPHSAAKKTGGGKSAEQLAAEAERKRIEALRDEAAFNRELERVNADILREKMAQTTDLQERAAIQAQLLEAEHKEYLAGLELQVKTGDLTQARADLLKGAEDQRYQTKQVTDQLVLTTQMVKQTVQIETDKLQQQQELLELSSGLARTAKERRDIELRLLELAKREEAARLQGVISDPNASKADKDDATARAGTINQRYDAKRHGVLNGTRGPLEDMLSKIPQTADEINEAFQNIAAEGLSEFADGLTDAILEAKSLGEVFENVAKMIIRELIKMIILQAIVKPIGNAISSLIPGAAAPAGKALGGPVDGGAPLWVGERGPEMFVPRGAGKIIPNHALGGGGSVFNIDARGSTNPAETRRMIEQALIAAEPMFRENAANHTLRKMRRPQL
jgi:uncharacterized phage infection (PIP) family protein YhgE